MKTLSIFSFLSVGFCFAASLQAGEEIESKSPDGKFGLRNVYNVRPPYDGNSEIVDTHADKTVVTLDADKQSSKKLVWSKDSQGVAYFKDHFHDDARWGSTRVFYRDGSPFTEIELPELPSPKLPPDPAAGASEAETRPRVEPIRWLDSGDLVLESEVQNHNGGRAALEITIAFDQQHWATIRKSESEQMSVIDYFLLLPKDYLEGAPDGWLRMIRHREGDIIDVKNGYMRGTGDGAQGNFQVALFRFRDGRPLLVVCKSESEGEESVFLDFFELGPDKKMHKVPRSIFPVGDSGNDRGDWRFELPRYGKTILVRKRHGGRIMHGLTWNGEKFLDGK